MYFALALLLLCSGKKVIYPGKIVSEKQMFTSIEKAPNVFSGTNTTRKLLATVSVNTSSFTYLPGYSNRSYLFIFDSRVIYRATANNAFHFVAVNRQLRLSNTVSLHPGIGDSA